MAFKHDGPTLRTSVQTSPSGGPCGQPSVVISLSPAGDEKSWETVYRAREKKRQRRIRRNTCLVGGNRKLAELCDAAHLSVKTLGRVEEFSPYTTLVGRMRTSGKEKSTPVENRYMCLSEPRITGEENFESGTPKNFDFLRAAYISQRDRFNFKVSGCVIGCTGQGSPSGGSHVFGCEKYLPLEVEENKPPMPELSLDSPTSCQNSRFLGSLFKRTQRLLYVDRGMVGRPLSHSLECGGLRTALEKSYDNPSIVEQLSIKTSQKLEPQPCDFCKERFALLVEEWKGKRKEVRTVDENHLLRFQKAFNMNIGVGWNQHHRSPFVPNGHGSLENYRSMHGNWNLEEFSSEFRTELVFSSGKPRIVTLYSSGNTSLLKPLHSALFGHIKRRKWLLVGPPTEERVSALTGGAFESFDYKDATNNINLQYVQVAIEALIQKGVGLSCKEKEALRVVSHLQLDGESCGSGQPMGSLMSFPLLCLINKTMVDLALADTLNIDRAKSSSDSWNKFVSHPCLINGDDLGLRDPGKPGVFRQRLIFHGEHVGLTVNEEKSLRSDKFFEINSTVFSQGESLKEIKKTNCGVLRNSCSDTGDFISVAKDSTTTMRGLRYVLACCADSFGLQREKHVRKHPELIPFLTRCRQMREALTKQKKVITTYNPFPVEETPDGYWLSNDEVFLALSEEVERVRPIVLASPKERIRDEFALTERIFEEIVLVDSQVLGPPADVSGGFMIDSDGSNTMVHYRKIKDYSQVPVNKRLREKIRPPTEKTLVCLVDFWKRKVAEGVDLCAPGMDVSVYDTTETQFPHLREKIKKHVSYDQETAVDNSLKQTPIPTITKMIGQIRAARATQSKVRNFFHAHTEERITSANEAPGRDFTPLHDGEDLEIENLSSNQPAFRFAESLCSLKGMVPAY